MEASRGLNGLVTGRVISRSSFRHLCLHLCGGVLQRPIRFAAPIGEVLEHLLLFAELGNLLGEAVDGFGLRESTLD